MCDDQAYGINPTFAEWLPLIQADNERNRLRNIKCERQYQAAIERINRSTDREINEACDLSALSTACGNRCSIIMEPALLIIAHSLH